MVFLRSLFKSSLLLCSCIILITCQKEKRPSNKIITATINNTKIIFDTAVSAFLVNYPNGTSFFQIQGRSKNPYASITLTVNGSYPILQGIYLEDLTSFSPAKIDLTFDRVLWGITWTNFAVNFGSAAAPFKISITELTGSIKGTFSGEIWLGHGPNVVQVNSGEFDVSFW